VTRFARMAVAGLAAVVAAALASCGGGAGASEPSTTPPEPQTYGADVLFVVDDAIVLRADYESFLPYIRSIHRQIGDEAAKAFVVERHLLPLALARLEFGEQRRERLAEAEALVRAVGNGGPSELEAKARHLGVVAPEEGFGRAELPLAVARRLFDETTIGQLGSPVEVPQGYAVVASSAIFPGTSSAHDRAEGVLVPFYTHGPEAFEAWLRPRLGNVKSRIRHVAPDFRNALKEYL
jgi:hypothetical protein